MKEWNYKKNYTYRESINKKKITHVCSTMYLLLHNIGKKTCELYLTLELIISREGEKKKLKKKSRQHQNNRKLSR